MQMIPIGWVSLHGPGGLWSFLVEQFSCTLTIQTPHQAKYEGTMCSEGQVKLLTWMMSLVHAAFSCLDEATRMTVKGGESFGSTPILNSRCSISGPAPLAFPVTKHEISRVGVGVCELRKVLWSLIHILVEVPVGHQATSCSV